MQYYLVWSLKSRTKWIYSIEFQLEWELVLINSESLACIEKEKSLKLISAYNFISACSAGQMLTFLPYFLPAYAFFSFTTPLATRPLIFSCFLSNSCIYIYKWLLDHSLPLLFPIHRRVLLFLFCREKESKIR